jgi:hypothetical protein
MDEPREISSLDLSAIEALHSIDTARMALRWALERIHGLEKTAAGLSEKLERESSARETAENERAAMERALRLRAEEVQSRQAYYAQMQEFVQLRLSGNPEASTVAGRELELARQQELLHQRKLGLEKECEAKLGALESEYQQMKASLERETQERLRNLEQTLTQRQARLDQHEKARREALERDIKDFEEKVQAEVRLRLGKAQAQLLQQLHSEEAVWTREKESFLKELAGWPQRVSAAEEAARVAQTAADQLAKRQEAEKKIWGFQESSLSVELDLWRSRASALNERMLELQKQLAGAREVAQSSSSAAARRLAEMDQDWMQQEEDFRTRDRQWHERFNESKLLLREKQAQLEEMRMELIETIRRYKRDHTNNEER